MVNEILSRVDLSNPFYLETLYEWAEETAKYFNVPVKKIFVNSFWVRSFKKFIKKIFRGVSKINHKAQMTAGSVFMQDIEKPLAVGFVRDVHEMSVFTSYNCIPVFIDVWDDDGIEMIIRRTKGLKLLYVTALDIFNRMKELAPDSSVRYMPLSVSDRYYSKNFEAYRKKSIDVIQFGRKNPVLHEYMLKYCADHKNIEYIYLPQGYDSKAYISTTRGIITRANGRKAFIELLSAAKVCLVSSPGMDKSKDIKFDWATPRFYESAILGCALIGRYPDNQEFRELNMSRYCPNVTSYKHFVECLERALAQMPEELYAQNHDFIINSLTSKRAEQIHRDLAELTGE